MCHKNYIAELDTLAKQLWICERELTRLGDPVKAYAALDTVVDRIEVGISRAPQAHVVVVNALTQAQCLAQEAAQVIFTNYECHVDPEAVASGLLVVARVRLQQACWELERVERLYPSGVAAQGV